MNTCLVAFKGKLPDPVSDVTHLGNGYRAYNPILMRFNCPDSLSSFRAGGISPSAYCKGDPLNQVDPLGHMSTVSRVSWGVGLLSGIAGRVLSVITDDTSLGVTTAILSSLATSALGLAAAQTEHKDPNTALALGWSALAVELLSIGTEETAGGYKILNRVTAGLRQRLGNIHRTGLSGGAKEGGTKWPLACGIIIQNYLSYIHDDKNFSHEINFMNNHYKIRGQRIGNETFFTNKYRPDK